MGLAACLPLTFDVEGCLPPSLHAAHLSYIFVLAFRLFVIEGTWYFDTLREHGVTDKYINVHLLLNSLGDLRFYADG